MQTSNETTAPELAPKRGRGRPPKGEVVDYSTYPEKLAIHRLQIKKWREDNPEKYKEIMMKSYYKNRETRLITKLEKKLEDAIQRRKDKTLSLVSNHLLAARDRLVDEPVTTDEDISD